MNTFRENNILWIITDGGWVHRLRESKGILVEQPAQVCADTRKVSGWGDERENKHR
jgi:hypothetical protein